MILYQLTRGVLSIMIGFIISIIFGTLASVLIALIIYDIVGRIYKRKSQRVVIKK